VHPYVLLPLAATVTACAIAGAAWARDPGQPANRLSAALMLAVAFWGLCDTFSQAALTPEASLRAGRLAGLGFLWVGPLLVHLHVLLAPHAVPVRLRRSLPALYAATPLWIGLAAVTPWFIVDVERLPWGWAPVFGPLLPGIVAWVAAYPLWIVSTSHRRAPTRMVGSTARWLLLGLVVVAVGSELAYPVLGLPVPSFATACVSAAAALLVLGFYREGRRVVAPRRLAQELLDAFPDGIALRNADGTVRSANANLARLIGCPRDELRGRPLAELLPDPRLHHRGAEAVLDLQTTLATRAGHSVPVSVSTSLVSSRDGYAIGRVVSVRDLRPVLELRGHLVTAGRLAAVGELAASITHEINNPVAFVRANLGLLDRHLLAVAKAVAVVPVDPGLAAEIGDAREVVAETLSGADRVADIVRDVRSFSGAGHQEREVIDLNQLCEEALRVSLPRIPDGVSVHREYRAALSVPSDARALVQVLLNLITNAAQAVSERGTIWISTDACDEGSVVRVADDGAGIPSEVLERIFDPFFTTKPVGEGTGLGLAISRQIIENHGGALEVEERPGGGTTFVVRLPGVAGREGSR
jgi:PAS domain S-box-containing protein